MSAENEVGNIVGGTVTNITNFGAFVKLDTTQEEGLVHISEIANKYVNDISQFLEVGDKVQVKILEKTNDNKLKFSIKQAKELEEKEEKEEKALFIHKKSKNVDFEDKLNGFMKKSEEKLIDIRRNLKNKQGIVKRKKRK
jgi:S1 RNA binding domain protein